MPSKRDAADALKLLHDARMTGRADRPIPEQVLRDLAHERLVEPDAAGEPRITERGEQHLQTLRRTHSVGQSRWSRGRR
jgi:hypothetical protein